MFANETRILECLLRADIVNTTSADWPHVLRKIVVFQVGNDVSAITFSTMPFGYEHTDVDIRSVVYDGFSDATSNSFPFSLKNEESAN